MSEILLFLKKYVKKTKQNKKNSKYSKGFLCCYQMYGLFGLFDMLCSLMTTCKVLDLSVKRMTSLFFRITWVILCLWANHYNKNALKWIAKQHSPIWCSQIMILSETLWFIFTFLNIFVLRDILYSTRRKFRYPVADLTWQAMYIHKHCKKARNTTVCPSEAKGH